MKDLTAFQRDLLYVVVHLERPNGLTIKRHMDEYYHTDVHHGRLYPNLDVLVEKGLVAKHQVDGRTNAYELTDRGRGELADRRAWEDEWLDASDVPLVG